MRRRLKGKTMRESILTIPVNDVFMPRCGCPICRMRDTVEQHISEYIMGAAMMEPDVRIETNRLGFCHTHFNLLLQQNNRLSLGLMLESHLAEKEKEIFSGGLPFARNSKAKKAERVTETCFVCEKVEWGVNHTLETVFNMYVKDPAFKKLFAGQEYICLPHYTMLRNKAQQQMSKGDFADFDKALTKLVGDYMHSLQQDVSEFCKSFDYRNAGKLHNEDMEHVRSSVLRAIQFLTGREGTDK